MVAVYCTYLTMSAVSMEPDESEDHHCNPLGYGAGTHHDHCHWCHRHHAHGSLHHDPGRYAELGHGRVRRGNIRLEDEDEHTLVTTQPGRREMRAEALRRAVEEGSLPADALLSDDEDDNDGGENTANDDERSTTQYSYAMFPYYLPFLATAWVATLLTMDFEKTKSSGDFARSGVRMLGKLGQDCVLKGLLCDVRMDPRGSH